MIRGPLRTILIATEGAVDPPELFAPFFFLRRSNLFFSCATQFRLSFHFASNLSSHPIFFGAISNRPSPSHPSHALNGVLPFCAATDWALAHIRKHGDRHVEHVSLLADAAATDDHRTSNLGPVLWYQGAADSRRVWLASGFAAPGTRPGQGRHVAGSRRIRHHTVHCIIQAGWKFQRYVHCQYSLSYILPPRLLACHVVTNSPG